MEHKTEDFTVDLMQLARYLSKKLWIMAIVVAITAVCSFAGHKLFTKPQYTASTRVYLLYRVNENSVSYADLQTAMQLLCDYQVLVTGQNVTKKVIEQLELDMTPNQLAAKIEVTAPENTRVMEIRVTDGDPERAASIANRIREISAQQVPAIMGVDAVNTVYAADVPTAPSGRTAFQTVILFAAVGLLLSVVTFVVIFIVDDTLRTEEDVEKRLGLNVLGVIPLSQELSSSFDRSATKPRPMPIRLKR